MADSVKSSGSCTACLQACLVPFGTRLGYDYHRCTYCGTVQLYPLPTREQLADAYSKDYATAGHYGTDPEPCVRSSRTYHRGVLKVLRDLKIEGRVLDFGSGWGGLIRLMKENHVDCEGLELSGEMVAYCQKLGLPVSPREISSVEPGSKAAITLAHVFEHLVGHEEWLREARKALQPGGYVITMQPTAVAGTFVMRVLGAIQKSPQLPEVYKTFHPPWHTVLFSLEGMRLLAKRSGFELVEVRPAPQGRADGAIGAVQITLERVNTLGWRVIGERWPLITGHTFVLRKLDRVHNSSPSIPLEAAQ